MRLGTAIALELVVAAGAIGGVAFGVTQAARLADNYLVTPAVADSARSGSSMQLLPRSELRVVLPKVDLGIFGASDTDLLAPLGASPVVKTKLNHGGTSLSLRLDFASGARAAFKPQQIYEQSDPRKEIAAFKIDRLLRIGRVPPATWGSVPVAQLVAGVEERYQPYVAARLADESLPKNGVLYGEFSWWVPEVVPARIGGLPMDEMEGRLVWQQYLAAGAAIPAEVKPVVSQLSTMIVFDALVDNDDRWSGGNLLMSPDRKVLYTMDNTLTFSREKYISQMPMQALRRVQVYSRDLVKRLRGLTLAQVEEAVTLREELPGAPRVLLTSEELAAMMVRRDRIVEHIDRLIAELGEDAVLAL